MMLDFKKTQMPYICTAVALLCVFGGGAVATPAQANPLEQVANILSPAAPENSVLTAAAITQALEIGALDTHKFRDVPGMKAFYEARGYEAAWLSGSFMRQRKAKTILNVLEAAWMHGLNPATYNIGKIKTLIDSNKADDRFALDLLLSDALVRYGRDLTGMRVSPKSIGQRSKYWRKPLTGFDILEKVSSAENTKSALENIIPQGQLYQALQKELVKLYKTNEAESQFKQISIKGILRPGTSNKAVLRIRERMGFDTHSAPQGAYYYDDQLAQAVMAFQKGQGVKPDGIVGPQTVKLMNITREDRINQILVNLERLRWVEPNKPERYVMVNVPSAMLWAIDGQDVALEMPVVVGRKKRPTNIFSAQITGIRFNPRWTVPPTIKRDDYLPKLRADPYYLTNRGIELMDNQNMTVDPGLINWEEKTWGEVNQMRMVQGSGRSNPLGLVRVIMNNPYNIYLHDTPNKSQFKRSNRTLSSGCVRMSEPQKLADFVLKTNDNWSQKRKDKIMARGRERDIIAQNSMPVYILYQTVWLGDSGQIVYGHDLYGHDRTLLRELKKIDAIALPVSENIEKADGEEIKTKGVS